MKVNTALALLWFILILAIPSLAIQEVRFEKGEGENDVRMAYKVAILRAALDKTIADYGPYTLSTDAPMLNTLRARQALQDGEIINVFIALMDEEWETKTIPIRIPIRRGILNFRILLIHKDDLQLYKNIHTIEDLKRLKAGLQHSWTTTRLMEQTGFEIVKASSYEGLFTMLNSHRYHYLPRGIHEIYDEFDQYKDTLKNIAIEPELLLILPTSAYVFVSPKYPKLAKRLEAGLESMVQDGTLKAIFDTYFAESIEKANLHNRRIIRLTNPSLPQEYPLDRPELWFDPFKER
jgi:ABC-type amino acid transport substrate-binding protein